MADKPLVFVDPALLTAAPETGLEVDFVGMRATAGRLCARVEDARRGLEPVAGRYSTAGSEDAGSAVGRGVVSVNPDGDTELEVSSRAALALIATWFP